MNQYLRDFQTNSHSLHPQIKVEPTALCDVDLKSNDDDFIDDEDDEGDSDEDYDEFVYDDNNSVDVKDVLQPGEHEVFKVPSEPIPLKKIRKKKRSGFEDDEDYKWPALSNADKPPKRKLVPLSLKTCSECGETFLSHDATLAHWKEKHPDKNVSYKCTVPNCVFATSDVDGVYKHRKVHRLPRGERKRREEEYRRVLEE